MSAVGGQGYYYGLYGAPVRVRRLTSYKKSRSRSRRRKFGTKGSRGKHGLLTVASYLYRKTGKSWFVGPGGVYLSVPEGVRAEPAALKLVADIPEVRGLITYSPAQNQLHIPTHAANTLAKRLTMRDETIRAYCQKIGAPHEQRFFGKPYACDPWLAAQMQRGRFGGFGHPLFPDWLPFQ